MRSRHRRTAVLAVFLAFASTLLAGSYLSGESVYYMALIAFVYFLRLAVALILITGPVFFLACVIGTTIVDLYVAFRYELKPETKDRLDAFLSRIKDKYFFRFAVTSSSAFEIYNAEDHMDDDGEEGERVSFSKAELMRQLRNGRYAHENLSEELKAAVLEAMIDEYRKGNHA